MTNVVPLHDSYEHADNSACLCRPRVMWENGAMIIVHRAFDKREKMEELRVINKN